MSVFCSGCIWALHGQSSLSPAFNPAYNPTPDPSRKKIVVTSTSDVIDGDVSSWAALIANPGPDGISLREALTVAQITGGAKEIDFAPALKGAVILLYTSTQNHLPYLTSGDLVLDGDIDHDGQPDVTLDGTAGKGGLASLSLMIWSNNNHVNGLQFQNFLGSVFVQPDPNTSSQPTKASGNRFTNSRVYAQPTADGITVGTVKSTLHDFIWENITIAGNAFYGTNNNYGVHVIFGCGAARNQIIGTIIQDNVTFGSSCGVGIVAGDANSTWNGNNVSRKPGPVIYSDGNLIKDTVVQNNRISEAGYKSIEIQSACDGNCQNLISNLTISGNTITHSKQSTLGISLACVQSQIGMARPLQGNAIESVLIEKNVVENHKYGIFVSGSEAPLEPIPPPGTGQLDNQVRQMTVRQNTITNYANVGIYAWGGRGNTGPDAVQGNRVVGLDITNNILTTNKPTAIAGIFLMGGLTLDEVSTQFAGPARQNSIEAVTISGNRIQGGAASIKVLGGRGPLAEGNYVTGLVLADNQVDTPPVVTDNDSGAVGNQFSMLPAAPQPVVVASPYAQAVSVGGAVTLAVFADGRSPFSYQWRKYGQAIPGATGSTLVLSNVQAPDAGRYDVVIGTSAGSVTSGAAPLTVGAAASRLANLSVRAPAGTGDQTLILGFYFGGTGSKQVLIRGIGPTLAQYGVSGVLADPQLKLFNAANTQINQNDDWGGSAALANAFVAVNDFALPANSKDAALLVTLPSGGYSAQVNGAGISTGVAMIEAYEADTGTPGARFIAVSARNQVGTGDNILIAGFVVTGNAPKTLLIRGIGPTLANYGVSGVLADPKLELYAGNTKIGENDNWGGGVILNSAFTQTSAFPLPANSKDATLLATLPPGLYSAQVSGAGGTTGVALVEVYEVP